MKAFPRDARLYVLPTGFVASPPADDGAVARLAGGPVCFSACEMIAVADGRRVASRLVPLAGLDAFLDGLEPGQAAEVRGTLARIVAPRPPLMLGAGRTLPMDRPQVMLILNMTPDSFSDGGTHLDDPAGAAKAALALVEAGAAIVDVGGESTRPGAKRLPEAEEIARIEPVVRRLAERGAIVSIDTRKAAVMEVALAAGAAIVNDVSALTHDPAAATLLARHDCPVVLMHHQGDPETMQHSPRYDDALIETYDWLAERVAVAEAAGIARRRIVVDPGIGFGKTLRHNLQILNGLALYHGLGCPVLLGASRKRIVAALDHDAPVGRRLGGSLALALQGAGAGAQIIRVHDVPETLQALRVWQALRDEAPRVP